jgi:hypothetical protein
MNPLLKSIIILFITANYFISVCIFNVFQSSEINSNSLPLSNDKIYFSSASFNLFGYIKNSENNLRLFLELINKSEKKIFEDKFYKLLIETIFRNEYKFYSAKIIPSISHLNISISIYPFHYFW